MLKKTKVAVLVSGGGTNLQAIIDACAAGRLKHVELTAVISGKEGAYALTRAEQAGIATFTVNRRSYSSREAFEAELTRILRETGCELIVLAGFLCVLSEDFVKAYPERIINVHPSLIPSFCGDGFYGLRVHEAALAYGVKYTGATVHFVNEITDGGRIIAQKPVRILPGDTPEILQKRVMEQAEWKLLPAAVEQVAAKIAKNK